jgi:hypothetical protein
MKPSYSNENVTLYFTYFQDNAERIESWFNIITPRNGTIKGLHSQISQLRDKNWETIHSL